jgi:hypothetical protein
VAYRCAGEPSVASARALSFVAWRSLHRASRLQRVPSLRKIPQQRLTCGCFVPASSWRTARRSRVRAARHSSAKCCLRRFCHLSLFCHRHRCVLRVEYWPIVCVCVPDNRRKRKAPHDGDSDGVAASPSLPHLLRPDDLRAAPAAPNNPPEEYRKEMGDPEAGTIVTMHVLVRPAQAGKAGACEFGRGGCVALKDLWHGTGLGQAPTAYNGIVIAALNTINARPRVLSRICAAAVAQHDLTAIASSPLASPCSAPQQHPSSPRPRRRLRAAARASSVDAAAWCAGGEA